MNLAAQRCRRIPSTKENKDYFGMAQGFRTTHFWVLGLFRRGQALCLRLSKRLIDVKIVLTWPLLLVIWNLALWSRLGTRNHTLLFSTGWGWAVKFKVTTEGALHLWIVIPRERRGQRDRRQLDGPQRNDRAARWSTETSIRRPSISSPLILCRHRQTPTDTDVSLHYYVFGGKVILTLPKCALTSDLVWPRPDPFVMWGTILGFPFIAVPNLQVFPELPRLTFWCDYFCRSDKTSIIKHTTCYISTLSRDYRGVLLARLYKDNSKERKREKGTIFTPVRYRWNHTPP